MKSDWSRASKASKLTNQIPDVWVCVMRKVFITLDLHTTEEFPEIGRVEPFCVLYLPFSCHIWTKDSIFVALSYKKNYSMVRRVSNYLLRYVFNPHYSWDRIVGEQLVLKTTEENKTLMKQLTDVARKLWVLSTAVVCKSVIMLHWLSRHLVEKYCHYLLQNFDFLRYIFM